MNPHLQGRVGRHRCMLTGSCLASLLSALPASACPERVNVTVDVFTVHGPVATSTDFTLSQIQELAQRSSAKRKHEPLGFYFAGLAYNTFIDLQHSAPDQCVSSVHITAKIALIDRHIEIGRELALKQCRFTQVRDHYARHAADDDKILTQVAHSLGETLQRVSIPFLQGVSEEDYRLKINEEVTNIVEEELNQRDTANAAARDAVDTPDAIRDLSNDCTSAM